MTQASDQPRVELSPAPDRSGGARVELADEVSVAVVSNPRLRAVDVVAGCRLKVLDLSGCAPGLFVSLIGAENVERIIVPQGGAGAVLFMVLGQLSPPLRVEGSVQMIDATCRDSLQRPGAVKLDCERMGPFEGVWLGTGDVRPPSDLAAMVVSGGTLTTEWLSEASSLSTLVLDRCEVDELQTPLSLRSVVLTKVGIRTLRFASAELVRMDECPVIEKIAGQVQRLVMRGGAKVSLLSVDGHVGEADLMSVRCRTLRIPAVSRLLISGEHQIRNVQTMAGAGIEVSGGRAPSFANSGGASVRPLTPADIEREFVSGSEAGRAGMVAWARKCRKPSEYWLALQVMSSAVDTGVPAEELWADRCALMPSARSVRTWAWNFPTDLAIRGWTADVRFWLRCLAQDVEAAVSYAQVMAAASAPANIAALMVVAGTSDVSEAERDILVEVARRALVHGATTGKRLEVDPKATNPRRQLVGLSAVDHDWMMLILKSMLELVHHERASELAAAYAGWLARRSPNLEGVRILGGLAVHGCAEAHEELARLRDALEQDPNLTVDMKRQLSRAISLQLLQPPTGPFWAGGTTSTPEACHAS